MRWVRAAMAAVAVSAGLPLVGAPLAAQLFEGTVAMNVTGSNGVVHPMSYMIKNGKLRFDPGGGQISVILDPRSQHMTVIMNAQQMYMERDFGSARAAAPPEDPLKNPNVTHTGRMESIAGYTCEHVTLTDDDGAAIDVCVTEELGGFRMPAASNPMAPQQEAGWITQLGSRVFPLKVQKGGKTMMEVTAIEKKPLDAALFTAPEGYQAFSMPKRPRS